MWPNLTFYCKQCPEGIYHKLGKHTTPVITVTAEHPSNKGKNKVTEKNSWHGNILKTAKEELIETSALKLTPQEKTEFEVSHIFLKTNVSRQFKAK